MANTKVTHELYKAMGERIAALRRAATPRVTQGRLALLTKGVLSRSAIANIERGRQRLAIHHLYAIAEALNVSPKELLPSLHLSKTDDKELPRDPKVRAWVARISRNPEKER